MHDTVSGRPRARRAHPAIRPGEEKPPGFLLKYAPSGSFPVGARASAVRPQKGRGRAAASEDHPGGKSTAEFRSGCEERDETSAGHRAGPDGCLGRRAGGLEGHRHPQGHRGERADAADGEHRDGRVFRMAAAGRGRRQPARHSRCRSHDRSGRSGAQTRLQVRRHRARRPDPGRAQRRSGYRAAAGADGRGESRRTDLSP